MSDPYRNADAPQAAMRHITLDYEIELREVKVEKSLVDEERVIEVQCGGSFSTLPRAFITITLPYSAQALADLGDALGQKLRLTVR